MAEAAVAVGLAGTRPPPLVIDLLSGLADLRAEFQRTMSEPPRSAGARPPGGPRWSRWSR